MLILQQASQEQSDGGMGIFNTRLHIRYAQFSCVPFGRTMILSSRHQVNILWIELKYVFMADEKRMDKDNYTLWDGLTTSSRRLVR